MDAQHLRQVAGIDRPDAMFIRIQNKSANRTFVKYVPWEQRNGTADDPNKVTPFILTIFLYNITIFGFLYKCQYF